MTVIGVDPGASGAFAVYDPTTKHICEIIDMPVFHMTINNKKRVRIDAVGVLEYLSVQQMSGCELVLIEAVGGRPKQGASAAFVFGYGIGLIYMACVALKLPIETIPPQTWKKTLRVPGKKDKEGKQTKEFNGMIINRAEELMPAARGLFRGPKGGLMVDRAEAAMIAKYAGDYALRVEARPFLAVDTTMAYQYAEVGA